MNWSVVRATSELEYHFIVARDLKVVRESDSLTIISQAIEVRKMVYGLLRLSRISLQDHALPSAGDHTGLTGVQCTRAWLLCL